MLPGDIKRFLLEGTVIPAHPLALTEDLQVDEERQRRLTRYYMASGTGGVAVGVHTTQFEIRLPHYNLYEDVLRLAAEEINNQNLSQPFIRVAGIAGTTVAAVKEARVAASYGYHLGLLSMGGLNEYSEKELIERTKAVAEILPVFGFYLQPAVGGRILSFDFWKAFAEIENVHAIKVAAFNRYQTLDVVRAVCLSPRAADIALYTGNDDNIVADLVTPYTFQVNGKWIQKEFTGGLLGHWSVWTSKAVGLFQQIKEAKADDITSLLTTGVQVTDMNAAIFDPAHSFRGSIAGIHTVLQKQGLLNGIWCLNPEEKMSPGQLEEIDRVCDAYPELTDDDFVQKFLSADVL